jgi:hypothetical protein
MRSTDALRNRLIMFLDRSQFGAIVGMLAAVSAPAIP